MTAIPVAALVPPEEIHRVTIDEYRQFAEAGIFEGKRVELIDGWIVDMSPRSAQHEIAIRRLTEWCFANTDLERFQVMVAGALTLGTSEPEPDLAIIERKPIGLRHPSSAPLVIEVSHTSRNRDLGVKPAVYAPTVTEYWVVDLDHSVVVTHRDSDGVRYSDVTSHPRGARLTPVAVPTGELDTDALFAYAFAE